MIKLHTSYGEITIELFNEEAPITTKNFTEYVNSGYYDNTIFHRIINGFMIQGGGFESGMSLKEGRAPIKNEANNGVKNDIYTIAMARTSDVNSASSQFFINVADNDFLNFTSPTTEGFGYCVFGKVIEGQDVVDKIKKVETGNKNGHQNVPLEDVTIQKAEELTNI
tara:strand:- start:20421 stop:20921 length:501 start_codon:yes stop_codon:yes gene_type:complete